MNLHLPSFRNLALTALAIFTSLAAPAAMPLAQADDHSVPPAPPGMGMPAGMGVPPMGIQMNVNINNVNAPNLAAPIAAPPAANPPPPDRQPASAESRAWVCTLHAFSKDFESFAPTKVEAAHNVKRECSEAYTAMQCEDVKCEKNR